jgi:hypothetical protein
VDELTLALGKAYGGEARLLKSLGSQRFSLNKEELGYTPNKDKKAFASHKNNFVKTRRPLPTAFEPARLTSAT